MVTIDYTRLRYIRALTPDLLTAAVDKIGHRIEIKGAPIQESGGSWILWYIPPDNWNDDVRNLDLRRK